MDISRFNAIAIFDAIPDGELGAGRRLEQDLNDIASYQVEGLYVFHYAIKRKHDVNVAFEDLIEKALKESIVPWIHIDSHGDVDENGFFTSHCDFVEWTYLKLHLTALNVITKLNVVLILSCCFGGSFLKSMTTTESAPIAAIIAPKHQLSAGQLYDDFLRFYKTLFISGSSTNALRTFKANTLSNFYVIKSAEDFFYEVWALYKYTECSLSSLERRARNLRKILKKEGRLDRLPSIGKLKRDFRREEPRHFYKYRDRYFMIDKYIENRSRFSVSYETAEKLAAQYNSSRTSL